LTGLIFQNPLLSQISNPAAPFGTNHQQFFCDHFTSSPSINEETLPQTFGTAYPNLDQDNNWLSKCQNHNFEATHE